MERIENKENEAKISIFYKRIENKENKAKISIFYKSSPSRKKKFLEFSKFLIVFTFVSFFFQLAYTIKVFTGN